MDKVRLCGAALSILLSTSGLSTADDTGAAEPASAVEILAPWNAMIQAASRRFGVPVSWIKAVILAESGGRMTLNGVPITSPAGAMGLMQVMPATYMDLQQRYGLGADPYEPTDNIMAGTGYLAELYRQFGSPGLFAAYNAGPQRYQQHLQTGDSLPDETIFYLKAIDAMGVEALNMAADFPRNAAPNVPSRVAKSPLFFIQDTARASSIFVPLRSPADSGK